MENENESFNKLLKLQNVIKEEIAFSDIFFENRDELLKKIKDICLNYYKKRISIQEIYDNVKVDINMKKKYEIKENYEKELSNPQCVVSFKNILFLIRNNMDLTMKLVQNCPKESYESLANFICNNFYSNPTSSFILNENLLYFIYLLLEKEIDKLNGQQSYEFLEPSNSFCGTLLKCLSRNDEVKAYLEKILKKVLINVAGLSPNQKNKKFLGFDVEKINNFLKKDKCSLSRNEKKYKDYNDLLTKDIKKSRMNMKFLKYFKEEENEEDLDKKEINNNFYIQTNKDDLDNLLLGNLEEFDEIKILHEQDSENKESNIAYLNFEDKRGGKDDFETYLINSGFFNLKRQKDDKKLEEKDALIREEENKLIEKNRDKLFNDLYNKNLNNESLSNSVNGIEEQSQQSHDIIVEYINSIIKIIGDKTSFSNDDIIKEISKVSKSQEFIERFILIYKYHFEVIRQLADELLTSLIINENNTPYIIRAICAIIFKLLEKKFPQITNNQKILCVSNFFFSDLIIPILINPEFNGIMPYNFNNEVESLRSLKLEVLIRIMKKLLKNELFDSSKKGEENYTIFNPYLIEVMPHIIEFFKNLSSAELPNNISNAIKEGKNIEYKYLDVHPEEQFEYQSMCINWTEYFEIYNTIKLDQTLYFNKGSIEDKNFEKLKYNEDRIFAPKIQNDEKNLKKSYVYFFNDMSFINDELKEKITGAKIKKVAFEKKEKKDDSNKEQNDDSNKEQNDDSNNEETILGNIKYCFYVVLKNLNTLSRNNFNEDESIDNIIKKLNIIINKEDFNGTLKEQALPLNWYGIYLESYIDKIPSSYKENNYSKLYDELIDEYSKNINIYKNDESLKILYNKIINGENMIEISQKFLTKLKNDQKKLDILHFILTKQIPILIKIYRNNDKQINSIEFLKPENKSSSKELNLEKIKCNNIFEFCYLFPDLTNEDIDNIFQFEEEIKLKNALDGYFNIIYEYVKEENCYKDFSEEEKTSVIIKIKDYIYEHIYDKIYPHDFKDPLDINILKNSFTHKWIEPKNLDQNLINLDDKLVQMMRTFIRKIVERKSPNDKLKEFEKIDFMVNNIILLHDYPNDTYLKIMCLAFIKEQTYKSYKLNSLYNYIKIFCYNENENEIINRFKLLVDKIKEFSFKDIIGISEDEYKSNNKNALTTKRQ